MRESEGSAGDIMFVRGLEVRTIIGVFDWERDVKQTVCIDLEMRCDVRRAAQRDHIDATLSYKAVSKRIIGFVEASEFQLVETLAERIAELVIGEFRVRWLRLSVSKPGAVRGARHVGVQIERGAESARGS